MRKKPMEIIIYLHQNTSIKKTWSDTEELLHFQGPSESMNSLNLVRNFVRH